jgi:hypothetical protein
MIKVTRELTGDSIKEFFTDISLKEQLQKIFESNYQYPIKLFNEPTDNSDLKFLGISVTHIESQKDEYNYEDRFREVFKFSSKADILYVLFTGVPDSYSSERNFEEYIFVKPTSKTATVYEKI